MKDFLIRNRAEITMLALAFIGCSIPGIFAISHLFGLMNVLLSITVTLTLICAAAMLYDRYLSKKVPPFLANVWHKTVAKVKLIARKKIRPTITQ